MRTRSPSALVAALAALALALSACGGNEDAEAEADAAPVVLTIAADTVSGPLNIPKAEMAGAVCVLQSRFARNSEIVWRARVMDAEGNELDDTMLESVKVELADGQVLDMRYGPHPRDNPTDFFWTVAFDIPVDYPTGTLGYEIVAAATDGATGTFKPFEVAPSLLTVTDEVLETIEES